MKSTSNFLALLALLCCLVPAVAKRAAPAVVAPVIAMGLEFSAPHDAMGFVVATGISSGKEMWRVRIYEVRVNPNIEGDVQDVFITSFAVKDGALIVTNERKEKFALDLKTSKVTRQ